MWSRLVVMMKPDLLESEYINWRCPIQSNVNLYYTQLLLLLCMNMKPVVAQQLKGNFNLWSLSLSLSVVSGSPESSHLLVYLISTDLSNHRGSWFCWFECSSVSHVTKISNTDQLTASEILCNEGCHVLDFGFALLVAIVLDPCLSWFIS